MAARETEIKVELDAAADIADLERLPGVERVRRRVPQTLESTYYDSPGLRLARAHMTLRWRTGGDDAGWTLKLPGEKGSERFEVTASDSLGSVGIPSRLLDVLTAQRGADELRPVACLHTERATYELVTGDGSVLAEVADDRVTGRPLPDGDEVTWREVEVELVDGDEQLLEDARRRLMGFDGARTASTGKLFRTLGGEPPDAGTVGPGSTDEPTAVLVQTRLAEQVDELRRWDPHVRERLPGGVHQMRKAARRLRDGLATARPFLDRPQVQELRDELNWLSHELGVARDAEVQEARLQRSLEEVGHPADTSVSSLERSSVVAQRTVRDALGTDRYLLLLSRLDELVASPTWSGKAASSIAAAYLPRVARDWKRLAKRVATARDADDPGDRSDALHECRKAAKRFRYAVEPLVPVVGKPARRSVDDAKALQSLLGEHHDAVVGRRTARELAADAPADEAFALGAVVERERARLASLEASFRDVWGAAKGRKRHRWYG